MDTLREPKEGFPFLLYIEGPGYVGAGGLIFGKSPLTERMRGVKLPKRGVPYKVQGSGC